MMKKTLASIITFSWLLFFASCSGNTETKTNEEATETTETNTEQAEVQEVKNTSGKIKAKLDMIALGTGGGIAIFIDESGVKYNFFDDGNKQLHETITDFEPNSPDHGYQDMWFDIEYKTVTKEFYDGGTGKVEKREVVVITTITTVGSTSKSKNLKITEIKKDDIIENLTVASVTYSKGSHFEVKFTGELVVSGNLSYNEFEDAMNLTVEKSLIPETKIEVDGELYALYTDINFTNPQKLQSILGQQSVSQLYNGETVHARFIVKSLSFVFNFVFYFNCYILI